MARSALFLLGDVNKESVLKEILVIGNGASIFVKDFIHRYSERGAVVDLISLAECEPLPTVRTQLNCSMDKASLWGSVGRFADMTAQIARCLKGLPDSYDSIVIHYINFILFPHVASFKKKSRNLVAIMYGSDYYRSTWLRDKLKYLIYRCSNVIVFTNPKTREHFQEKYREFAEKLRVVRFGLPVLDEIDKLKVSGKGREEMCRTFAFPPDKTIILVGYSASRAHRQHLVIRSLSQVPAEVKSAMHLVFPLGYGEADLEGSIREELKGAGLDNFSILKEFYGFADAAKLRCVTDILVNIQPSDQFSGSMQETVYAGGTIVAGAWLPYQELIDVGCRITTIKEPEEVGKAVAALIEDGRAHSSVPAEAVRNFIQTASSWSSNIAKWDEVLYSGCRNGADPT